MGVSPLVESCKLSVIRGFVLRFAYLKYLY